MTAPNIVNVTTITGKTSVLAVTTSATAIVTNSGSSGQVYKINALYVSNVDGTNNADLNVDIYRSSTAYHVAKTVNVPADATLDVISKSIYLEEGDSLRLTANANSDLEAVCSYEIIA
jgi:Ca2+-dependent lipid-binding protein